MVAAAPAVEVRAPACLWVPPGRVGSFVDDVCEVAERIGRVPEPEQRVAIDALVAHDARKRFLSVEAGIEMCRQNGKTTNVMQPIALWTALTDPDEMTWSAHTYETALREFRALTDPNDGLVMNYDWLRRRVRSVSDRDSDESITFVNGAVLNFRCRSGRKARGLSGSTLFNDEWLYGTAEMVGSALPTLATRSVHGNARSYYASSAAKAASRHLRALRRRALAEDPSLTWVGWWARGSWAEPGCELEDCPHSVGVSGCALDDEDRWAEGNPLLDRWISRAFLRGVRQSLRDDVVEFGREHMGWQEDGDDAVDAGLWGRLADPHSRPAPGLSYGLAVAPKGKAAAIVAAGIRADGLWHVEIKESAPGTAWLRSWLVERRGKVRSVRYLGGANPTRTVVPDLEAAGVDLVKVPQEAFAAGCDALDQAVKAGRVRHRGDPRLAGALGAVARRDIGDGAWVMTWRGASGDASPAMAMALALGGLVDDYNIDDSVG